MATVARFLGRATVGLLGDGVLQFDGCGYLSSEGFHLVGFHFDVVVEVEVGFGLHGDEVDVCVGYFESEDCHAYFDAWAGLFKAFRYALGKVLQLAVEVFVEVEDVVHFLFGDAEYVAFHNGVDVEEGEAVVGFGNFVAWYFACYDS